MLIQQVSEKTVHKPVLLDKCIEYLDIQSDDIVVDGTLGLGGHAMAILKLLGKNGKLIGFDLDGRNMQIARRKLKKFEGSVLYVNDSYSEILHYSKVLKFTAYNKVLLDLGVSSPHFDIAEYGFSFQNNGPLDMRFNSKNKITAALIVNRLPVEQLTEIFYNFGEIKMAKRLATLIVKERQVAPFRYTVDFASRISSILPVKEKHKLLACIFQALRIAVNDELNVLKKGLVSLFQGLSTGGIMAVISYHSLEDRIIKNYFNELARPLETSLEKSLKSIHGEPLIEILNNRVITPSSEEMASNPRSRSAKLRVIKKL